MSDLLGLARNGIGELLDAQKLALEQVAA
jgi:hypothetical protein